MKGKRHATEQKIRILREADGGRNIVEVCKEQRSGLSPRHYQDVEAMRREGIRLATIEKIARVLRVPVWQLLQVGRFPVTERQRGKTGSRIKR